MIEDMETLKKDAARYRHLRDNATMAEVFFTMIPVSFEGYSPEEIDRRIDLEIEEMRKEKE